MKIVKFYLMKNDNNSQSLERLNAKYINEFCKKFGGATTYDAKGYWSDGSKLYIDDDLICEIFIDMKKHFNDNKKTMFSYFRDVAKRYKREARQEAVSVEIDGKAFIIE